MINRVEKVSNTHGLDLNHKKAKVVVAGKGKVNVNIKVGDSNGLDCTSILEPKFLMKLYVRKK